MDWRLYTPSDHDMVAWWWRGWNWPVIPPASLPNIGVIVSNERHDCCASFLYKTDSNMCLVDWYISNPSAPKHARNGSIEFMNEVMAQIAKDIGYSVIFSSIKNKHLIKKLETSGFTNREDGMTNLIRIL